ncbi:N-acetylmuramoyl-L-alanine amidase [Marinilactibacillus kalidii]|uniref:N-acetylmuramoyl-L-alanine amidase n=1 Tax=Marinilactibacillus kalidii TaxID=2820274 RepID=UPI001ABE8800|nr:N-acetylmuramoyl-L-alanine amidase [Marinilactibacillus kalidii]
MTVYGLYLDLPKFVDYRDKVVKHPIKSFPILSVSSKTVIAIHHSLTRIGLSGSNARGYSSYHVNTLGWPGIGYSYVIEPDGVIKFCNPINWRTYHVGNANNQAIGIVLTGDFRTDKVTEAQKSSLRLLVDRIKKDQKQVQTVKSHHEFPGYSWKACCVFNYKQILEAAIANPEPIKATNGGKYIIQEGDTFWGIAKGKDFEVVDLEHANPGVDPKGLKIGQIITLPSDVNKATSEEKQSVSYHGNSIQKYLESIGEEGSYDNRVRLADKYGIKDYKGNAEQNLQLLSIIRDGAKAPSTVVIKENNTINKGQAIIVPAGKLYAQGNATKPVKNEQLTAKVDSINTNWRNSVRLINENGVYVGFVQLTDLEYGSISATTNQSTLAVAREIAFGKHNWGNNPERAEKLRKAGYDPNEVQKNINQLLK